MLQSNILLENQHQNSAIIVVDLSNQLAYSSQNLSSGINELITSVSTSVVQEGYAVANAMRLNSMAMQLALDVTSHQRASNLTVSDVNQTLIHITKSVNLVNEYSVQVSSLLSSILNATSYIFTSVNDTQSVSIVDRYNPVIIMFAFL